MRKKTKFVDDVFENIKILIVGLGAYKEGSGVSATRFFARHGAKVIVNDIKTEIQLKENVDSLKKYKNIEFYFGKHQLELVSEVDVVFQNPGVSDTNEMIVCARKLGVSVINDWTLFFMHGKAKCIGITGTRGKTTTTCLLHAIIKTKYKNARLAGNVGISPLRFLEKYNGEIVVAELSSWLLRGLREIRKSPRIAIVTNIMNDHQNHYNSIKEYVDDKMEIFKHQKKSDIVILNYDNEYTRKMAKKAKSKVFWVGRKIPAFSNGVFIKNGMIIYRKDNSEIEIIRENDYLLIGEHNTYNVMFAIVASRTMNICVKDIQKSIKKFRGAQYRLEKIRNLRGIDYYNDTTATTPDATIAAVKSLSKKQNIILIAGGADKKLDYCEWAKVVSSGVKNLILIPGNATDKMKFEIQKYGFNPKFVDSLDDAVEIARNIAKKDDCVLFSPGAASFNMFKNEFARGEQFNKLVRGFN